MKNKTSFALCVIAGLMLIMVERSGALNPIALVYVLLHSISALSSFIWVIDIILFTLYVIALLGGVGVIIGGYLLTTSWVRVGKFIIGLSAGFGLLSLIIIILHAWMIFGPAYPLILTFFILNSTWATGIVLTIIARWIAKD